MIECAQFLKDLNKKNKSTKFEHILQEEALEVETILKRKRKLDINEIKESDDLFDSDWRSKY